MRNIARCATGHDLPESAVTIAGIRSWDNAVAESFFSSLKKERIKRHIYATRQDAKSDVFDYIEGFYNRVRRHSHLDQLSPMEFEQLRTGS